MTNAFAQRREFLALGAVILLAACQTVPAARFSSAQMAALEQHGFVERDGRYMLGINNQLLFPFDSSEVDPPKRAMLRDLARALAGVGIVSATVEGHASSEGDDAHNLRLSQQRAEAVRTALAVGGLDGGRMRVRGLGARDPVASNQSEEGRRQNRRVVIIVTPADAMRW